MIVSLKKVHANSPEKIFKIIRRILDVKENEEFQEHFYVIGLNNKNVIQYIDLISIGTVNEALVHPRDVFRMAIMKNCSAVILCHNHPSGEAYPSGNDLRTTERLIESSVILGIPIIDHIIIGGGNFLSMKESNILFNGGLK